MYFRALIYCISLFFILHFLPGCQQDSDDAQEIFNLTTRLASEPDNLHPMLSRSSNATPIESLIFLPLAEFDPYTLALSPLLVKSLAEKDTIDRGETTGALTFTYEIRPEARWADGKEVTAEDYLFTVKAALNPKVNASSWRGFLSFIDAVEMDPQNPRRFTVVVGQRYMLAEVVTCNFNILPRHLCDPNGDLDNISLDALKNGIDEKTDSTVVAALDAFATQFTHPDFTRALVPGSGPYTLDSWNTGESIILKRNEHWWADDLTDPPTILQAHASRIIYRIIPDEATALTALKDGQIDVMTELSAPNFLKMKNAPDIAAQFNFFTPALMQYSYLELNNRSPKLAEPDVRKALAHVIDYDAIIKNIMQGLAMRTIGPFHPDKPYYNDTLTPVAFDIDKAKALLKRSGWEDTNKNGTVDKVIQGERTELVLDIFVTALQEGQNIALLMKQNARMAGIDMRIITKETATLVQDLGKRDFEIIPLRSRTSPALNDPYQSWHSESDRPRGGNRSGFKDPRLDDVIRKIRLANSDEERNANYRRFQEILYNQQPVIFLYVPLERIVAKNTLELRPSSRRPGYFENLIRQMES